MDTIARKSLLIVAATAAALLAAGCSTTRPVPSEFDQGSPTIDGSSVAWEDSRNDETQGTDIFMYDLSTGTETPVVTVSGDQQEPAISAGYVVWLDGGRLRAKDRASGQVFNVTNGPATQTDPALCGSVVTWTDMRSGEPEVYARDLAGGPEIAVAVSPVVDAYPACDRGRVVYMHAPVGEWASIRLYDIGTGETSVVSDEPWNEWRPAISEDRVVWQAWPGQPDTVEGIQIRGKRLSTGQEFVVSDGPGHQTAPVISGPVVAWEDDRGADTRIWWRDLGHVMGESPADSLLPGRQRAPAVSGRRLAYASDALGGTWNIYTTILLAQ